MAVSVPRALPPMVSKSSEHCSTKYDKQLDKKARLRNRKKSFISRTIAIEQTYVHDVYSIIATNPEFQSISPEHPYVKKFILEFEPGSILLDIGCSDGQFFNINRNLVVVGLEHCSEWFQHDNYRFCKEPNFLLLGDVLYLPFRDEFFDGIICCRVLHHLSTLERRIKALKEIARTMKIGGRILLTVTISSADMKNIQSQDVLIKVNNVKNEIIHSSPSDSDFSLNEPPTYNQNSASSELENCYSFFKKAIKRFSIVSGIFPIKPSFQETMLPNGIFNVDDYPIELLNLEGDKQSLISSKQSSTDADSALSSFNRSSGCISQTSSNTMLSSSIFTIIKEHLISWKTQFANSIEQWQSFEMNNMANNEEQGKFLFSMATKDDPENYHRFSFWRNKQFNNNNSNNNINNNNISTSSTSSPTTTTITTHTNTTIHNNNSKNKLSKNKIYASNDYFDRQKSMLMPFVNYNDKKINNEQKLDHLINELTNKRPNQINISNDNTDFNRKSIENHLNNSNSLNNHSSINDGNNTSIDENKIKDNNNNNDINNNDNNTSINNTHNNENRNLFQKSHSAECPNSVHYCKYKILAYYSMPELNSLKELSIADQFRQSLALNQTEQQPQPIDNKNEKCSIKSSTNVLEDKNTDDNCSTPDTTNSKTVQRPKAIDGKKFTNKMTRQRSFSADYQPEGVKLQPDPPRRFSASPNIDTHRYNKADHIPHNQQISMDSEESFVTIIPANRSIGESINSDIVLDFDLEEDDCTHNQIISPNELYSCSSEEEEKACCESLENDPNTSNDTSISSVLEATIKSISKTDSLDSQDEIATISSIDDISPNGYIESRPPPPTTLHQYIHLFRNGELEQLIEEHVQNLHIIDSFYSEYAMSWCIVAEKIHVWTI